MDIRKFRRGVTLVAGTITAVAGLAILGMLFWKSPGLIVLLAIGGIATLIVRGATWLKPAALPLLKPVWKFFTSWGLGIIVAAIAWSTLGPVVALLIFILVAVILILLTLSKRFDNSRQP